MPRRDSNAQSLQARNCGPMPQNARPLESVILRNNLTNNVEFFQQWNRVRSVQNRRTGTLLYFTASFGNIIQVHCYISLQFWNYYRGTLLQFTAVLEILYRYIVTFHCRFGTIIEAHFYISLKFWNYYRGIFLYFTAVLVLLQRRIVIFHCSFGTIREALFYISLQFWNSYRETLLYFTAVLELLQRHIFIFHCGFGTLIEEHCYISLQFWNYQRGTFLYFTAVLELLQRHIVIFHCSFGTIIARPVHPWPKTPSRPILFWILQHNSSALFKFMVVLPAMCPLNNVAIMQICQSCGLQYEPATRYSYFSPASSNSKRVSLISNLLSSIQP